MTVRGAKGMAGSKAPQVSAAMNGGSHAQARDPRHFQRQDETATRWDQVKQVIGSSTARRGSGPQTGALVSFNRGA